MPNQLKWIKVIAKGLIEYITMLDKLEKVIISSMSALNTGYPAFGALLNGTGRPMVYSCSWPDYQIEEGIKV